MKKIIVLLLSILVLGGCSNKNSQQELQQIIDDNNYIVIDVRAKDEYDEGHIKDAINIPYDELSENDNFDINKTLLVYCKSGKRSKIAYDKLKSYGYKVYDLGAYETIDKLEKVK